MPDIAIGRKEIMRVLHLDAWTTARRWKKRYNLPITYLPNGKPVLIIEELKKWMEEKKWHPLTTL